MQIRWCPTDGEDVLEGLGFKGLGCMETPSSVFCKKNLKIQVLCNIDAGGFQKTESRCNALFFFHFSAATVRPVSFPGQEGHLAR